MSTRRSGLRKLSSASSTAADGLSNSSAHESVDRRPQLTGRPISNGRSSGSVPALSSSLNQRLPARSFVTHPSVNSMDPAQYSSLGVREQTAELASFAFNEPGSFKNTTSPRNRSDSLPGHAGPNYGTTNTQAEDFVNPQRWNDAPDVIHEVSEPVSPEGTSLEQSSSMSNITKLLRKQSSRSDCEQDYHQQTHTAEEEERTEREIPDVVVDQVDGSNEQTPLLGKNVDVAAMHKPDANGPGDIEGLVIRSRKPTNAQWLARELRHKIYNVSHLATHPKSWSGKAIWEQGIKQSFGLLPCVFLGVLLNVLDALSYGMILFPLGEPVFAKTGPDGISMFYVSCIVSQLVYSCGGSIFKGAVGSEMIEVVPFFHKMTYTIIARMGTSNPKALMATTITSYAMSSIITGIVFGVLGAFRLGSLVSFFPRHILVGCIGGVGFFLFVTGIEVSARIDGNLEYNLATAEKLFRADTIALWTVPLAQAVLLLVAKRFTSSPYLVPAFFISIAAIFYIVVAAVANLNIPLMREYGWVFHAVESGVPFYNFYSYYDFNEVDWKSLAATIPAMLALTFFGILHVPINIPALAIAAQEDDLNLNRELVAHGVSNALSGFLGSIQNYLVYVNSEMFISNGGNNRLAGLMLAAATFGVWVAGPAMIGYVPIMVVGALIFYLGIELLQEALYDTWGKMNRLEYLTVLAIVLVMGVYDFVAGILAGIVLACLSFVLQTSRKSAIRATYSGEVVESTVRRHPIQRHFLHEVGDQIFVTKLSGFLFFGSIVQVEKQSRALIEEEAFRAEPILYLIFDLAHVNGIDYSAAEAFTRMERILGRKHVQMIVSGVEEHSEVGKSLRNVGLWQNDSTVEFFETLNGALEFCENGLLKAFYRQRDALDDGDSSRRRSIASRGISDAKEIPDQSQLRPSFTSNMASSPRQVYLAETAKTTLNDHDLPLKKWQSFKQPLPLILQSFQELTQMNEDFWFKAVPFFERVEYVAGSVLFMRGERSKAFYLLETGILHAHYSLPVGRYHESIVAGTTCGELPFFSETPRTATVSAERDCVCWRLDEEAWKRMQKEWPEGAGEMLKIALKLTKERVDSVTSYVLTTAG